MYVGYKPPITIWDKWGYLYIDGKKVLDNLEWLEEYKK